jgi:hypothetical protein
MKNLIKKILKEEQDLEWAKDLVNAEVRPSRSLVLRKQKELPKNAIELHTETMHGDADSYDNHKTTFYRNGRGRWDNDYGATPNFEDFEKVVEFLRNGDTTILDDDENQDLADYFIDLGCIDYTEYGDGGYEMAYVKEIYYYDENGIKYDAHIEGLNSQNQDEDEDEDYDDEDADEEYCDVCGDDLDAYGNCPSCEMEDDEEEEDDEQL